MSQYAPVDDIAAIVNAAMRGAVGVQDAAALARALFGSPDSDVIIRKVRKLLSFPDSWYLHCPGIR